MTVFVGRDTLIAVQGTGIEGADDVWDRVLAFTILSHAGGSARARSFTHVIVDRAWEQCEILRYESPSMLLVSCAGLFTFDHASASRRKYRPPKCQQLRSLFGLKGAFADSDSIHHRLNSGDVGVKIRSRRGVVPVRPSKRKVVIRSGKQ